MVLAGFSVAHWRRSYGGAVCSADQFQPYQIYVKHILFVRYARMIFLQLMIIELSMCDMRKNQSSAAAPAGHLL